MHAQVDSFINLADFLPTRATYKMENDKNKATAVDVHFFPHQFSKKMLLIAAISLILSLQYDMGASHAT